MKPSHLLVLSVLCVAGLAGCTQGIDSKAFHTRTIATNDADGVFQMAQVVLRREFGPIEVEPQMRRIQSRPSEYRTTSSSGTARDLYRGESQMRRIAYMSVTPRDAETVARIRIEIERQDTERREVFQPQQSRLSDAPGRTPIERDAATTTEQNTVWTFVRRDYQLERALVSELQERFAPTPDEPPHTVSQPGSGS